MNLLDGRNFTGIVLERGKTEGDADTIMFSAGRFRRRWRFLRDVAARRYAERVRVRLVARGFTDRRGGGRTGAWLTD